jgi:hypothetical protein
MSAHVTEESFKEAMGLASAFFDRLITVSTGSIAALAAFGGLSETISAGWLGAISVAGFGLAIVACLMVRWLLATAGISEVSGDQQGSAVTSAMVLSFGGFGVGIVAIALFAIAQLT